MKYRLLAIDVDGTLLGPDHKPASQTIDAIRRARRKGMRICLATGRSYVETIDVWRSLELEGPYEPMVLIGGALVSEPDTGRSLYHMPMSQDVACAFSEALGEAGYAPMAIVDAWRHGYDYLLCETGDIHAASRAWFDKMNVRVRRVKRLSEAPQAPVLRISVVVKPEEGRQLASDMQRRFGDRLNVHAILAPNYDVTIVEGFAFDAHKWSAIRYVAQAWRIAPGAIAAVGDDVNDIRMVTAAGLGAAMPRGNDRLREMADVTASEGLAAFIDALVAGEFDGE